MLSRSTCTINISYSEANLRHLTCAIIALHQGFEGVILVASLWHSRDFITEPKLANNGRSTPGLMTISLYTCLPGLGTMVKCRPVRRVYSKDNVEEA